MIAYFPPHIPGELTYSRIARFAGGEVRRNADSIATALLGKHNLRFGIRVPNHVNRMLAQIPPTSLVTEEELMEGSLIHAVIPFLTRPQRDAYLAEARDGTPSATLAMPPTSAANQSFRFCPKCAREDLSDKIPPHWRTAHQHPGSTACHRHGCLLIVTRAQFDSLTLVRAADWIDPAATSPPSSEIEAKIASDLDWLLRQKSTLCPGPERLRKALAARFLRESRFRRGSAISASAIAREMDARWGADAIRRLDPAMADGRRSAITNLFAEDHVSPCHRYALCAHLLGLTLEALFGEAEQLIMSSSVSKPTIQRRFRATVVESAKEKLRALLRDNPSYLRSSFSKEHHYTYTVLTREAAEWMDGMLPRQKKGRGHRKKIDWSARDEEWCGRVAGAHAKLANALYEGRPQRIAVQTLLYAAGLAHIRMGRLKWLPKTSAALASLADDDVAFVRKRTRFMEQNCATEVAMRGFSMFKQAIGIYEACRRDPAADEIARLAWTRLADPSRGVKGTVR